MSASEEQENNYKIHIPVPNKASNFINISQKYIYYHNMLFCDQGLLRNFQELQRLDS